jgi:peptidoglycan/LPS O-acetylase OafA/YrhL
MTKSKVYFPGLNGLRFFAAFSVIITHVELIKEKLGLPHAWYNQDRVVKNYPLENVINGDIPALAPVVGDGGPLGVVFFFVLSGFLITYLLYVERDKMGRISVGNFYLRRIFRIWPLYYFLFIIGFFVLPNFAWFQVPDQSDLFEPNFWGNFWMYLCILPNLALSVFGEAVPNIGQSWSIGVEEQFYLVWPLLIRFFKKPIYPIVIVTGFFLIVKVAVLIALHSHSPEWLIILKKFLAMSKIECMTIGGLGAWVLYFKKDKILNLIYSRWVQILSILGIPFLLYFTPKLIQDGIHVVYSFLFLVIIMNVATGPRSILKLENKPLAFLGRISYGLYMYHLIAITFVVHAYVHFYGVEVYTTWHGFAIYAASTVLTILLSWISYELLELRFIKMKPRFTKIVSGEEAKEGV